jgi:hypothetical protein
MKQRVLLSQAKRGNQAVDRFSHRVTTAPKRSIMSRGLTGQFDAACFEDFQFQQLALHVLRDNIIADTVTRPIEFTPK